MKAESLFDDVSAVALGFGWLARLLAPATDYGRRASADAVPFRRGNEAQARELAKRTVEFAHSLGADRLAEINSELRNTPDIAPIVARVETGAVLDDADFLVLQRFCAALDRMQALPVRVSGISLASEAAQAVASALQPGRSGGQGFYLDGAFSPALAAARETLGRAEIEFERERARLLQEVTRALHRDELPPEEFIVMRDAISALPSGVRVLREAPTYFVCELDLDDAALAALVRRDEAAAKVAEAEAGARAALSEIVREVADGLTECAQRVGELDALVARARFAQRYDCVVPEIVGETIVSFEQGRFLPLAEALEREGRSYVPIDLELNRVAVLTGPNMGGKSVALQMCGFIAMCVAFGLPVPAKHARVGLFDEILWLGAGSDTEPDGLLSSFASEVVRLKSFEDLSGKRALVLVDEFAGGTSPQEGRALLVALAEHLLERGACGLLATHFAAVASAAGVPHLAVRGFRSAPSISPDGDLNAVLRALGNAMDYTLVEVSGEGTPRSDAIALAELLGMDPTLAKRARALLHDNIVG